MRQVRVDTRAALAIADAALAIARRIRNKRALAQSLRARANALYVLGENKAAIEHHERALALFDKLGLTIEVARTLSASIQPCVLVGEYERAFAAAARAREIFTRHGDDLRLARLEINTGNIYFRQDRFAEALDYYEQAHRRIPASVDPEGVGVVLHNIAVCRISLNDFRGAQAAYESALAFAREHGMPLLANQANYNIAWLYYQRGEYGRAIDLLRSTRESCKDSKERYHFALCNLDLSEVYLELNLSEEAAEMAQTGAALFHELGMGYEEAKCTANLAIALGQQGKAFRALEVFAQARAMFVREKNHVWPSLIDLYHALVLYGEGRIFEARRLCSSALECFRSSSLPGKAILCRLLMARIHLRTGDLTAAHHECGEAIAALGSAQSPGLSYQAHLLMGNILTAMGQQGPPAERLQKDLEAYAAYQAAKDAVEGLRSGLRAEELKIAFMRNRLEVYERLVELCMSRPPSQDSAEEIFRYMERAKSRSLMDQLLRPDSVVPESGGQSELVRNIRGIREELNWYYRRIELEQLKPENSSSDRVLDLQARVQTKEAEFLRLLHEIPPGGAEASGISGPSVLELETIREALPEHAMLVEYFAVGERLMAAVLSRRSLQVVPVSLLGRVSKILRLLQLQMAKFRLDPAYFRDLEVPLLSVAQAHLGELYRELFDPLVKHVTGRHLIFVPHHVLHHVPFHALYDGERYLIDSFTISYAPSASVYALCHQRSNSHVSSLVMGVSDAQAPLIEDEARTVAALLPDARLLLGPEASETALAELAASSRFVHIATHGFFRQDNPLFSAIRLGDSYLSLHDLYRLNIPAELVTLSGCGTGLTVVAEGDELRGLMRGLLCAGAQSLLLSLWDVNDRSTTALMQAFYRGLLANGDKAEALRQAMLHLRRQCPHPYHWAPFILVGKFESRPD
ncbi:MAG: CHAT domain-containing protein [Terriglobales bacterium]